MIIIDVTDLTYRVYLVLNSECTAALKCLMMCFNLPCPPKSKLNDKVASFLLQFEYVKYFTPVV